MVELLIFAGLLIVVGYVAACFLIAWQAPVQPAPEVRRQQPPVVSNRRASQTDAYRRRTAREMQLAILQLSQSPDFRRAASFAASAAQAGVPAAFRQHQFRRLRPLLLEHLVRMLRTSAVQDGSVPGLSELVRSMGVAAYEADYLLAEASQAAQPPRQVPNYRQRLRELHADHMQRLQAIENMTDLEEEIREQLIEAEHERFRTALLTEPGERG